MAALRNVVWGVFAAVACWAVPAAAQAPATTGTAASPSSWWGTGHGYVGLSVGRSRYSVDCGGIAFVCDRTDQAVKVTAGAMSGNYWGVELGYLDLGKIARAGGTTRAQGLNLSLVGKAPVAQRFNVFGKLGATYGRTETSTAAASALAAGTERGLGLSYGAGVSWDFTPRLSATLEWDSNDFRFASGGRDPVRSTSLGLQYRY
ncbi:outer membrane beta-barrel protein [Ramlibacter sp.]|uniref:outer membrane beta-barrel protein n=1 Tax=Ramlibacter sp. TaxID=1917967 RepID=UPI002BA2E8AD|nr:outer membrane beta-barrel protein [Ramlibacter sp.]HWI83134.1 outer membrane beta-barrel protein [Ramlibacter sp.]